MSGSMVGRGPGALPEGGSSVLWHQMRREARGGGVRLFFFIACLAVGVGAVVSVAGFSDGIDAGIRREARSLLAADMAIRSRQPIDPAFRAAVEKIPGSAMTEILETLTVVAIDEAPGSADSPEPTTGTAPANRDSRSRASRFGASRFGASRFGASQLVELKAVGDLYPFYGELEMEPQDSLGRLLKPDTLIAAPELLQRFDLEIGDSLKIGGQPFTIAAVLHKEPDRLGGAFSMGPRVLISIDGFHRAQLAQYGSRIVYRQLVRLPQPFEANVAQIREEIATTMPDDTRYRTETYLQAQPSLRRGLRRTESYLGLAALLSLIVGGVGIAQTVRTWLAGRLDSIAIYKSLGLRPRQIVQLYLGQIIGMACVAGLVGILLGVGLMWIPAQTLRGILPVDHLEPFQPLAWLQGLGLGVGVSLLFAWPPLWSAQRVPPIRVLRRSAEPLPPSRWAYGFAALTLVVGIGVLAALQAQSVVRGALFAGGLVAVTLILGATSRFLIALAQRPRRRARLWLRQGLAALARPGASTMSSIIALGLGVLVVFAMFLVEQGLSTQLQRDLPTEAPSTFLIDIQPHQWPSVQEALTGQGAESFDSVPVVMARLTAIDGRSVNDLVEEREKSARERGGDAEVWTLRREQRLTYLEELPEDNKLVAGALWQRDDLPEVSLEKEFADSLEVTVGSTLDFDIQGVDLRLHVTSIREVDWSTFGINFFLVAEPNALEEAPQHRIAAARLDEESAAGLQDRLAVDFPNITVIQIREVLQRVSDIIERLGIGIRWLGALTVLVGLAILSGAVTAGAVHRGKEVALLKTMGMTRRQIVAGFATEYAMIGAVAGLVGTAGAAVLAYFVLTRGMEVEWSASPGAFVVSILGTITLSVVAGLAASVPPLRRRPVEALRHESQ